MSKNHKGVILKLRESRTFKGITAFVLLNFLFELVHPSVSLALTEGPSQPEVQSFEPISTNQMVNLFTGDFNYNIPLMNVPGPNGGYPINIAYNAGVSMDDEASWVGLGWNINPGSLVRNKRGLPDEFSSETESGYWSGGDFIYTKSDMKESWTIGTSSSLLLEIAGADLANTLALSESLRFNNYNGLSMSVGAGLQGFRSSPWNLGLSLDSDNGLGVDASFNYFAEFKNSFQNFEVGISFNGNLSLDYSLTREVTKTRSESGEWTGSKFDRGVKKGSSLSFARNNFSPSIGREVNNYSLALDVTITPATLPAATAGLGFRVSYNTQDYNDISKSGIKRPVMGYASSDSRANNDYYTKDFVRENDGQITKESAVLPSSYYAFDSYFSSGQGLAGFFRGRRNDVGAVHDVKLRTETNGIQVNIEVPATAPLVHTGTGVAIPFGWDNQGRWASEDAASATNELAFDFNDVEGYDIQETHYYKVHGEQTLKDESSLNYVNSTDLALATFEPKSGLYTAKRRIKQTTNNHFYNDRDFGNSEREVRNTLVHSFKNEEVAGIGEFDIKHYEYNGPIDYTSQPSNLNREKRILSLKESNGQSNTHDVYIDKHHAGFKVLNEEGAYYVYGLPAYNKKEVQNLFSVDGENTNNFDPLNTNIVDIEQSNNMVDYKANGSHKFIDKKTTSPYPHSYLLTSVQGADYVDVTNNGPTDDDLGHWVKFDYVKYADDYKWRAPYAGANYSDGQSYTRQDDKGSYQFGEKEMWYVGRVETKTHIAIFELEERQDNLEAESELINVENLPSIDKSDNKSGLMIKTIKLYKKQDFLNDPVNATPIKTVHFEYDYSLCKGIPNSVNSSEGKLTLKKVWFTYQNSERGKFSPYIFDYTNVNLPAHLQHLNDNTNNNNFNYVNPDYFYNAYDPWGNFKPYEGLNSDPMTSVGYGTHSNFPYVNQTPNGWRQSWMANTYVGSDATEFNRQVTKEVNDLLASTWSLRSITLPSGGEINIEYESDDYSHVQHKVANQLFKIVKLGDFTPPDQVYTGGSEDFDDSESIADEHRRRIYFKLEKPLEKVLTPEECAESIYRDYVEPMIQDESGQRNLYFKSRMRLTFNSNNEVYDYIRGYLPIEKSLMKVEGGETHFNFGVLEEDVTQGNGVSATFFDNGTEYYSVGYITIQPGLKKNGSYFNKYHPMALSAWTYMQSSAPKLLNPASIQSSDEPENAGDIAAMFTNILNVVPQTASSFGFIRSYCKSKNFAQFIDLENSGIRLASPDKIKYGGGHRVKSISITDNWSTATNGESSRTYGQDYDYTTTDEYGNTISSGVAQYEPQAGGDENALKYPVHFYGKNKLFTNNNLFTEMPVNESLFPGAQVGYRKVSVTSINTREQITNKSLGDPTRGRTGGVTIHEFYTAKEFPTIIDYSVLSEENDTKSVFNVPIPIPLIGTIRRNYYHGSQAFKIELNDMHGKPKSVKSFETNNYEINAEPITESAYEYRSKPFVYQNEQVQKLVNKVDVIPKDNADFTLATTQKMMGVDVDLFTDQRENKSFWNQIGLDFNADIISIAGLPSFWPSYNNHKTLFRTYVTNKVVHRTGILKKSISRDLQTVNESEVLAYDEKSGIPILTKVKNEFGDSFYKSDLPAYYQYDKMGHAYQNINYTVVVNGESVNIDQSGNGQFLRFSANSGFADVFDHLVRGDEVILQGILIDPGKEYATISTPSDNADRKKAYYLGTEYDNQGNLVGVLHFPFGLNTNFDPINYPGLEESYSIDNVYPVIKVIRSGRRNHYSQITASYTTKDLIASNGNQVNVGSGTHVVAVDEINDVLSAGASLYKDNWLTRATDLSWNGVVENPYLSGNSGIWRPYKSYTYAGKRNTQTDYTVDNTSSDPNLREDGLMDNVPMFTWDIGNIEDSISDWEWVNEITRFSPDAYEIENRNRLDIHSSALYGYDNSLTIGVGGNAEVREIGVFDFEMSSDPSMTFSKQLNQTNLNFDNAHAASSLMNINQCDIEKATIDGSNLIKVITDIPFSQFSLSDYEQNVGLTLTSEEGVYKGNEGFFLNGTHNGSVTDEGGYAAIYVTPFIDNVNANNNLLTNSQYHGKLSLLSESNFVDAPLSISYTTESAHTGDQSMEVNGQAMFDQPRLKLKKDKKYILSVWVSRENTNVVSFETSNLIELGSVAGGVFDPNGINVHNVTYSKIIEGWQKVDLELSAPSNNLVLGIQFNPGIDKLFVDDVRFSAKTGGISTYVYGADDLWLRAELNADNYATLYYYDEEGNLTLKKQETEEGIFTVTESRGHVSE
ncbi:MAG: hypothetical protein COA32_02620 [Fluviicola sp.]|nr:MAG: hypothetical protein COA32_02620 [Fluviicola sp.]